MKKLLLLIVLFLVIGEFLSGFYVVDRGELVYVTRLGKHVATLDGAKSEEAGLHLGWPWPFETVIRLDRRQHHFVLPPAELVTRSRQQNRQLGILMGGSSTMVDPVPNSNLTESGDVDKTITIDAYVVWRIPNADAADRFVRTFGSIEKAEQYLREKVRSDLGAVIPKMSLEDLHAPRGDFVHRTRDHISEQLLKPHRKSTEGQRTTWDDGIEVIDIRLRRTNHPPAVRQANFTRIVSERNRKAAEYESEGQKRAAKIRTDSDATIQRLRAKAKAEAQRIRGEAEADAEKIRNEAQALDPEYYAELKRRQIALEGFSKDTTIWSTRLWELLFPRPERMGKDIPERMIKPGP